MAEDPKLPQVHGVRMRVGGLAANGTPEGELYVSRAFTQVALSPVYTDGAEIDEPAADGQSCVYYKSDDTFKRLGATVSLCSPDPYLQASLGGGDVIDSDDVAELGDRVGFRAPALGAVSQVNGISVEVWARRVRSGTLDPDSPYAHHAYPKLTNLRLGDWSHGNAALLPSYTGQAYENPNFGDGPAGDFIGTSDRVHQWIPVDALPSITATPAAISAS